MIHLSYISIIISQIFAQQIITVFALYQRDQNLTKPHMNDLCVAMSQYYHPRDKLNVLT